MDVPTTLPKHGQGKVWEQPGGFVPKTQPQMPGDAINSSRSLGDLGCVSKEKGHPVGCAHRNGDGSFSQPKITS